MQVVKIIYTLKFLKSIKKVSSPKLLLIKRREQIFLKNPLDKRLKAHKLQGKLLGYWSFSITYSERILFRFVDKNKVLFILYGSHNVYK
jgi:mRNA-degrading endonuclease YafQ of YafQ-DinJ toxin-antitoxin module